MAVDLNENRRQSHQLDQGCLSQIHGESRLQSIDKFRIVIELVGKLNDFPFLKFCFPYRIILLTRPPLANATAFVGFLTSKCPSHEMNQFPL